MKMKDMTGMKPRSPKQIVGAGFTLAGGFLALPLIKIKTARKYRFKGPKKTITK